MIIMRYVLLVIIGFILGIVFCRRSITVYMDSRIDKVLRDDEFVETIGDYGIVKLSDDDNGISFAVIVDRNKWKGLGS